MRAGIAGDHQKHHAPAGSSRRGDDAGR
jgi:hypothetical protein